MQHNLQNKTIALQYQGHPIQVTYGSLDTIYIDYQSKRLDLKSEPELKRVWERLRQLHTPGQSTWKY